MHYQKLIIKKCIDHIVLTVTTVQGIIHKQYTYFLEMKSVS